MAGNILAVKDLSKTFHNSQKNVPVLHDVNMDIRPGEFISIVGHSGCGKSTLLKIIAGLIDYQDGSVLFDGKPIREPDESRGMVFQEHRLFPWLTIKDNIGMGIHRVPKKERGGIIQQYMELVRLNGFEKAYPRQLSGGMAQRAAIARALVGKPKVLLLDEPFGALDALTRIQMQQEILNIWEKEKTTMILVTHDIGEAVFLSDRVIAMSERPSTVDLVLDIQLARPRDRTSPDFIYYTKKIYSLFFKNVEHLEDYSI